MRKTYRKNNFESLNKQIIIIGLAFILFAIVGAYLNKIWDFDSYSILNSVNPIIDYYDSDIDVIKTIISNLKSDVYFMSSICVCALFIILVPIMIINFMLKGLSIGYTINSCILALKLKSIKMIFLILLKNIIIIPGTIILMIVSFSYVKVMIDSYKKKNRENMLFLGKRYLLNGIIIIAITVVLQLILNTISINIIKFLAR